MFYLAIKLNNIRLFMLLKVIKLFKNNLSILNTPSVREVFFVSYKNCQKKTKYELLERNEDPELMKKL